jgi:phosphoribosylformylglycinamidine cyclo-ligase
VTADSAGPSPGEETYRRAGVDLHAAARAVSLIKDVAAGASRAEVAEGVGGFAGLVDLGEGRMLAASTDGVGTKIDVARRVGKLDTVGIDCVAMCANDVVCTGAEPLFFLDYLAVERLVPEEVAAIVGGVAEGCRRAGCALLGGETAEHPGAMPAGSFDLAGFCVGLLRQDEALSPERVRPGDVLVGLASSGVHANGFSLVRDLVDRGSLDLAGSGDRLGRPLGEELLEPTTIYVRPVLELARAGSIRSAAHITGGGLLENVPRALPPGLGATLERSAWTPQPIFELIAEAAGMDPADLFGVLNMGIGFVLVVSPASLEEAVDRLAAAGYAPAVVGTVHEGSGILLP